MLAEGAMKDVSLIAGAMFGSPITSRCLLTVIHKKQRVGCVSRKPQLLSVSTVQEEMRIKEKFASRCVCPVPKY